MWVLVSIAWEMIPAGGLANAKALPRRVPIRSVMAERIFLDCANLLVMKVWFWRSKGDGRQVVYGGW